MKWLGLAVVSISCCLFLNIGVDCQQWNDHRAFALATGKDLQWTRIVTEVRNQLEEKGVVSNAIGQALHNLLAALKSTNFPTAVGTNVSQQCKEDSQLYVHSLYGNLSLWALQSKFKNKHLIFFSWITYSL